MVRDMGPIITLAEKNPFYRGYFHETQGMGEQTILHVQKTLLTPSLHVFHVAHIDSARLFLTKMINSLGLYTRRLYYSSFCFDSLAFEDTELIHSFIHKGYSSCNNQEEWIQFFLADFSYDFLWLELSPSSHQLPFILISLIATLPLVREIPIVILYQTSHVRR